MPSRETRVKPDIPTKSYACPLHGSWAKFIRLSHVRAKSEFRCFKNGTGQLRGTTPTENHRSSRIARGGHGADNPTPGNCIVQKPYKGCRMDVGRRPCKRNKDKDMKLATWIVRRKIRRTKR